MKKALIVIDVQEAMYTFPVYNGEVLLENLQYAIEQCRTHNIPVIFVQHNGEEGHPLEKGTDGWEIHPRIAPLQNETIVEKTTPDSFRKTSLGDVLREQEIEHLIICGMQTEYCVDTTVRRAFSEGFKVTLIRDGHSTFDGDHLQAGDIVAHHNRVLASFADTENVKEVQFR
ncbi:isochorismatase [Bacillus manliponensis]|uniref:Isochorismatase n=1 Tax=Bacillus manliponensis TaxID=574376 RepID=A0A073KBF1_9BACI|nr:cysteine hydrolase family protein [Bacillus manliponensis]KEK19628.1 isochorismatase [Bacillus manliponensis]